MCARAQRANTAVRHKALRSDGLSTQWCMCMEAHPVVFNERPDEEAGGLGGDVEEVHHLFTRHAGSARANQSLQHRPQCR